MADDLGFRDLGCYGQKRIQTPHLDRMAREGTRFTDCYAGAPVCAPSRNVLMTGFHTGHTRIRDNSPRLGGVLEAFGEGQRRLSLAETDVTVAGILKPAGYATGITGKWGLAEPNTAGVPNRKGFDEWLGYLNQNHAAYYYPTYLWKNETRWQLQGNQGGRQQEYAHDLFTDFALDFIRRHRRKPFFLYVAYTIPHERLEVPDLAPYQDRPWPGRAKTYAAMVTRLDRDVGRMLDLLHDLTLEDNTIVFFTSDNGAPAKSCTDFFQSSSGLRGQKGTLFEGGLRVPMIVRWPGHVPAGEVSDAPWYFADVMPTLAALAGVAAPACDGMDVSPILLGKRKRPPNRFLYWESPKNGLTQAVRFGNWKAIRRLGAQELQLYDLAQDPLEQRDVSGEHPGIVSRVLAHLQAARTESPHWPTAPGTQAGKYEN